MITGIIKCLPEKWYNEVGGEEYLAEVFDVLIQKKGGYFQMSLSGLPRFDVLHCYLLINGFLRYRLNIIEFRLGSTDVFRDRPVHQTWTAKHWVMLGAPVVKPESPIKMSGFQGIRYTREWNDVVKVGGLQFSER